MIQLQNVSEIYSLKFWTPEKVVEEPVHALKNVSLEVLGGESLTVIGENGAGKTTLLKVIAGLIDPTLGQVNIEGRVGVIMDLGCGFHPDLTGRENCLSSAPLYGRSKEEIEKLLPDIERFAELGKFFHAPIRTYSQGMYLRLAFAFAIHLKPDILCIDDILTVGDEKSRYRCLEKVEELRGSGVSVLLVTHDLPLAESFAARTLWMQNGQIHRDGTSKEVVQEYLHFCHSQKNAPPRVSSPFHWSTGNPHELSFKSLPLTRLKDWGLEISDQEKDYKFSTLDILETGKTFLRGVFKFESPHFTVELIASLSDPDFFRVELFLENPLACLSSLHWTLNCPWEIAWEKVEINPLPDSFLSVTQLGHCRSSENRLDLQFCFEPLLTFQRKQYGPWILKSAFTPPPYPIRRSRLCALSFKRLESHRPITPLPIQKLSQHDWKMHQVGHGFRLSKSGETLLNLLGFEILFEYRGQTLSSSNSEINPRGNSVFSFQHPQWPLTFLLSITFEAERLVLKLERQFKIPVSIRNLRFQIFWASCWKHGELPIHQAKNTPLILKNEPLLSLCVQTHSPNTWLWVRDYFLNETKATVTTLFDPEPDPTSISELEILWNPPLIPEKSALEKDTLFQNGSVLIPPLLTGWQHYCSLFSSPIWHDSLQALWARQDNGIHRGRLPWIPVALECETKREGTVLLIGWRLQVLEKTRLEKIQLCFPLQDNQALATNQIDADGLLFSFLKTLEHTKAGQTLLNFTWLPDPIFLDPGTFDLGWIRVRAY